MPRKVEQVAGSDPVDVVAGRLGHGRQAQAQFLQSFFRGHPDLRLLKGLGVAERSLPSRRLLRNLVVWSGPGYPLPPGLVFRFGGRWGKIRERGGRPARPVRRAGPNGPGRMAADIPLSGVEMNRFEDAPEYANALVDRVQTQWFPELARARIKVLFDVKRRKSRGNWVSGPDSADQRGSCAT